MNERIKKIEEFFDNDENEIREVDYLKYNNFRHQKIRRMKTKPKKSYIPEKIENNKEDDKKKKLLENKSEKEKKDNFNKLSKIELIILALLKRISFLCENKMIYQIIFIYLALFTSFLLIIIFMKNMIVSETFNYFEEKTYYPYVESDIVKNENMLKIKADTQNNNIMISALNEQLLFMEIYTQELSSHNIFKKNIFNKLDNDELETYENELGENFKTTSSLKYLVNEDNDDDINNNIKNLIPFYYHFIPIIYHYFEFLGMKMINFYFIGNDNNCNKTNLNNLYFKYPLEDYNLGIDFVPLNNKIYDYIIDPFPVCNSGYNINEDLLEIIKENNWYYNLIKEDKNIEIDFRFFKLMKMSQETVRKDFYIIYNKFNLKDKEGKISNFLFSIRLSKLETKYPFVKENDYNDTLNSDYFSIFNFGNEINQINISNIKNNEKSVFEYDYNIDDSKNIILKTPKFIENMNLFGLEKKEDSLSMRILKNEDKKLSLDSSIMLKYDEINNISQNYDVNYYYDSDILYYKLAYFINQFYLYKLKYPQYLLREITINSNETIEEDHPCSISNIDEYYNELIEKFNYDCIYDYCYYHSCDTLNNLYINKTNLYLPNCYCLPLFCKDEKTQKNSKFESRIKEQLNLEENEQLNYSFTSSFDFYYEELQRPFSKIASYFNRNNFRFRCQIIFNKRNIEENKYFLANILYVNFISRNNIFVFVFLYNNSKLGKLLEEFNDYAYLIIKKIVLGYLFIFLTVSISLFVYVYITCSRLIRKMKKFKNIRKSIIKNSNDSYNNKNKINNIIENKEENNKINNNDNNDNNNINNIDSLLIKDKNNQNINNINTNENENLIINQENKEIKSEKQIDKNSIDEFDELIKLINDNLNIFKIEFSLTEELNDNINNIKKQYNEIIQVNKYKNKLLLNEEKEEIILDNYSDSSMSSSNNSIKIKKNNNNTKKDDLSVNILSELLSLSNHKFDFSKIKTNFYYKENDDHSLYNLNEIITTLNENNNKNSNDIYDITNIEKVKSALEHYSNNIHSYWKNYYDVQKARDEI